MLRLGAVSGDGVAEAKPGGTSDMRPLWSGDGGRRWVGDGKGISVVLDPGWSTSRLVGDEPPVAADMLGVPGARYFWGRRYWDAVSGLVWRIGDADLRRLPYDPSPEPFNRAAFKHIIITYDVNNNNNK